LLPPQVAALRKSTAGQLTPNEQAGQVAKHVQMLESRLEKSLAKFSETLSGNKVLRDEIEQLHKELTVLQELRGRHAKELQLKRDELAALHHANRLGGKAAQEAKAQAAALHVLDEKEQQLHEQEVAELERVQAAAKQLEEAEGQQRAGAAAGRDGDRWSDSDEQIEQIWGLLQVACGCSCREDVVAWTAAAEEQNYALFETCSRADQSVSQLQQDVERLRGEIQQLGDDQEYVHSKSVVRELQQAVDSLRQRSRRHEEKAAVNRKSLLALQPAVASLAGTVGLPPSQVSAAETDVAQGLLQHLGSIETRARLIVMVYTTLLTRQLTAS
jgi:coiled-coil domain-containing protein 63/114